MIHHHYGTATADFTVGDRVATHPGTAAFLSGYRYGIITGVGRSRLTVSLERCGGHAVMRAGQKMRPVDLRVVTTE